MRAGARHLVLGFVVAGMVVMTAGLAWACTPMAEIKVNPSEGAPGSRATVDVRSFNKGGTAVSIYWNTVSADTKLGEASAPNGSLAVTIPSDAAGGPNWLWAVQVDAQGGQWTRSVSFDVIATSGEAKPPGGNETAKTDPDPAPSSQPPASPRAKDPATKAPAGTAEAPAPAPSGTTQQKNAVPTGSKEAKQPARAATAAAPSATATPVKTSPAASASDAPAASAPPGPALEPAAASPSIRSGSEDLWSGFRETRRGGTLAPTLSAGTTAEAPGSMRLAFGVAMLSVGVLLVPAAFLTGTILRRRRATV